jgi:hypothetical protein
MKEREEPEYEDTYVWESYKLVAEFALTGVRIWFIILLQPQDFA